MFVYMHVCKRERGRRDKWEKSFGNIIKTGKINGRICTYYTYIAWKCTICAYFMQYLLLYWIVLHGWMDRGISWPLLRVQSSSFFSNGSNAEDKKERWHFVISKLQRKQNNNNNNNNNISIPPLFFKYQHILIREKDYCVVVLQVKKISKVFEYTLCKIELLYHDWKCWKCKDMHVFPPKPLLFFFCSGFLPPKRKQTSPPLLYTARPPPPLPH